MNSIIKAMRLDYFTVRSLFFVTLAISYVIAIALSIVTRQPVIAMVVAVIISVFIGGNIFSVHEKNNCSRLYAVLPLNKTVVVVSRYLYALVIGVVNIILAGVCSLIISRIISVAIDPLTFWVALSLMFVYYCLAAGLSYPLLFGFSFAKASISTMAPWIIIIFALALLSRVPGAFDGLNTTVEYFQNHTIQLPIFGVVIGLILLALSAPIANLIYARKEI